MKNNIKPSGLAFNKKLNYTLNGDEGIKRSVSVIKFPGGETNVNVNSGSTTWVDTADVLYIHVYARIQNGDDLFAVLETKDALERVYPNADINLFMPYIPYARQDRVCVGGESLSLKVFAGVLNNAKFKSVTVVDPHSATAVALIDNCYTWSQYDVFAGIKQDWMNWTIVAPDMGASKKCEDFAKRVGAKGVLYFNKARELSTGKIKKIELLGGVAPVGEKLLILDDICDAGRTFVGMLPSLEGNTVELAVTHGIFSAGVDVLTSVFSHVYTTNSWSVNLDLLAGTHTTNLTVIDL